MHELAKELGMTNKETLDLCESLGIGVKTHSSSIEDAQADRVRRKAEREGLIRDVQPEEPAKPAKAKKATAKATEAEAPAKPAEAPAPEVATPAPAAKAPATTAPAPPPGAAGATPPSSRPYMKSATGSCATASSTWRSALGSRLSSDSWRREEPRGWRREH